MIRLIRSGSGQFRSDRPGQLKSAQLGLFRSPSSAQVRSAWSAQERKVGLLRSQVGSIRSGQVRQVNQDRLGPLGPIISLRSDQVGPSGH